MEHPDKAEQLWQLAAKQPSNKPIEAAKHVWEKQPIGIPASSETERFDSQNVNALLSASEQVKKLPFYNKHPPDVGGCYEHTYLIL